MRRVIRKAYGWWDGHRVAVGLCALAALYVGSSAVIAWLRWGA